MKHKQCFSVHSSETASVLSSRRFSPPTFSLCIGTIHTLSRHCLYHINLLRRRRDLNPRAAINDLHPFQGCPFNLLGTSPWLIKNKVLARSYLCSTEFWLQAVKFCWTHLLHSAFAENVGFEPTVPCRITGFQDQPLKPLGQLSETVLDYLTT